MCKPGLDSHHGEECPELADRLGTGALKAEALWKGRISCGHKESVLDSSPVSAAGWPWPDLEGLSASFLASKVGQTTLPFHKLQLLI